MEQPWYHLKTDFSDSVLSKKELNQSELIIKKEKELMKQNYLTKNGKTVINFNNIINRWQYSDFTKADKIKLSTNGFLIMQAKHEQLFRVYEDNSYKERASFVTTDSMLQLYHMYFDFILRNIERDSLLPALKDLTENMFDASKSLYESSKNNKVREAARRNMIYFAVPLFFLTGDYPEMDPKLLKIAKIEADRCLLHSGRQQSLIFNTENDPAEEHALDYAQFVPRGHYTRDEKLKKYFMAMMWYGLNYFLADRETDLMQFLIITRQMNEVHAAGKRLADQWQRIYDITKFYVGATDDLDVNDCAVVINKVTGKEIVKVGVDENYITNENFCDSALLQAAKKAADDLSKKTRIKTQQIGIPNSTQFRFMGQRYIPDSEILQRLTDSKRLFPKGLDIMAAIGSTTAKEILLETYKENGNWWGYSGELDKLNQEFSKMQKSDWQQNIYYYWIWTLKALFEEDKNFKYPFFMNNEAWKLKDTNTALASWAELRHDTILYSKPSGAEGGEGEGIWRPEPAKAYVEPNVEFYKRLEEFLTFTKDELKKNNYISDRINEKFQEFIDLTVFLKNISLKEMKGEEISNDEYERIADFGGELERLTLSIMVDNERTMRWFEITSETDKNIAVVADVHTSGDQALEEAVGPAFDIYVVVEIGGYLKLLKGAVFSYYEFKQPANDRLTDEEWQSLLRSEKVPALPEWTADYISNTRDSDANFEYYSGY
jgi:hypothetical protein